MNRTYVTWSNTTRALSSHGESLRREAEMNDFYDGKCSDPLILLRANDIAGVVIWPGDNISDEVLDLLKKQLTPAYEYFNFRTDDTPNIGIFVYQPLIDGFKGKVATPSVQGLSTNPKR